jgi:hypothetical protein
MTAVPMPLCSLKRARTASMNSGGRAQVLQRHVQSGWLQPIAVNPDGVPYVYRVIDPRQFILSAS